MRLTLISLQNKLPPLGLAYIASYLRKYGDFNDIKILTFNYLYSTENTDKVVKKILSESPDIIGFSSVTQDFNIAKKIASKIKSVSDIPIIIGGPHITSLPYTLPKCFDIAVLGEGEKTMLELLKLFEKGLNKNALKNVKGIAYHHSKKVKINPRRELIQPLDEIPFPARDLLKKDFFSPRWVFGSYWRRGTHMITSRGCPYNCIFCSTSNFWGKPVRFFSPKYVVEEMNELINKYNIESINIYDDLFISNKKRIKKICELMVKYGINKKVELFCMAKSNLLNDEICKILKKMNVKGLSFGFESGSERILRYLKKGTSTVKQNSYAVKLCEKYGIDASPTFMIGIPGEEVEDIKKTLNFIKKHNLKNYSVYILTPFPGTELWEYAKSKKIVHDNMNWDKLRIDISDDLSNNVVVADKLTKEQIIYFAKILRKMSGESYYSKFDVKLKDLFSFSTLWRFFSSPRFFIRTTIKIFFYKLKRIFQF